MAGLVAEIEAGHDRLIAQAEALGPNDTITMLRSALREERVVHATQTDALRLIVSELQAALAFATQTLRDAVRQQDPDKDYPVEIKYRLH